MTCSFSFGRGSACIVDCINVAGAPCQGAYTTYGPYGKGAYAALGELCMLRLCETLRKIHTKPCLAQSRWPAAGLPAGGDCPGVEVLLVKVAQEYHLTDQQTVTTVALPVNTTEVLAVPAGGAVNATPPADFVSRFPQSYQQLCAGASPSLLWRLPEPREQLRIIMSAILSGADRYFCMSVQGTSHCCKEGPSMCQTRRPA